MSYFGFSTRSLLLIAICLSATTSRGAAGETESVLLRWKWNAGELEPPAEFRKYRAASDVTAGVRVTNPSGQAMTIRLASIQEPKITTNCYALRGLVQHDEVLATAYLEMWSFFADGSQYFSRTLASSGPMGSISGTSEWRHFLLPFQKTTDIGTPTRLEFNLVMADGGTVEIRDLMLVESESPVTVHMDGAWWQPAKGNFVGAWAGAGIGILGGLLGMMSGVPVIRRHTAGLILVIGCTGFITGLITLVVGIVAFGVGQPWHVWYPLVLLGGIVSAVFPVVIFRIRRTVHDEELRRISAIDVPAT